MQENNEKSRVFAILYEILPSLEIYLFKGFSLNRDRTFLLYFLVELWEFRVYILRSTPLHARLSLE